MSARSTTRLAAVLHVRACSAHDDASGPADRDAVRRAWITVADRVRRHEGAVIETGDADVAAIFESSADAVTCALAVLEANAQSNALLSPAKRVRLAAGVHLGEVGLGRDDPPRAGREVAAALAAGCPWGSLRVSEIVREQIRRGVDARFVDRGQVTGAEDDAAVRVYELAPGQIDDEPPARRPSWPIVAAAVALLLVAGAAAGVRLMTARDAIREDVARHFPEHTLVVLPIEAYSTDATGRARRLTRLLLANLGDVAAESDDEGWRIVHYLGTSRSASTIAGEVGADRILVGALGVERERLNVELRLMNVNGAIEWSEVWSIDDEAEAGVFARDAAIAVRERLVRSAS